MSTSFIRAVCRILIASLLWLPLQAQAELIATTGAVAVAAAQAQSARTAVAVQLEALGVDADGARLRAASLTDAEALDLAARMDAAPAGGTMWALLLLAIFLIWRFGFSEQAKAEQKAAEPKK
jgi:hypothetical protein